MKQVPIDYKHPAKHVISGAERIPYLQFPVHWEIKVVRPKVGAVCRFLVRRGDLPPGWSVSIQLWNSCGPAIREPHWEIYPHDYDAYVVPLANTEELLEGISEALDYLAKEAAEERQ